ncbi:hypothetical protein BDW42DRAFT_179636 [Aspergillus taichungensis]|uniref:Uncharacterized protein n=1 Tax=Aspergillus taichungensis TaxID=482145 RepID=A0A2J5HG77_9EURO|nr:hypothetical protein BDW42DRAFT_179636 [Aspergillus taichungensis]
MWIWGFAEYQIFLPLPYLVGLLDVLQHGITDNQSRLQASTHIAVAAAIYQIQFLSDFLSPMV